MPEPATVLRDLRRGHGRVNVLVNPWAEVLIGGKSYGVTPIDPVPLPAGTQVITLRNKELNIERKVTVQVPSSGSIEVRADLLKR